MYVKIVFDYFLFSTKYFISILLRLKIWRDIHIYKGHIFFSFVNFQLILINIPKFLRNFLSSLCIQFYFVLAKEMLSILTQHTVLISALCLAAKKVFQYSDRVDGPLSSLSITKTRISFVITTSKFLKRGEHGTS